MTRNNRYCKRPIFILGFSRGGTNILLNFLLSHPDLCSPGGELHQVLRRRIGDNWLQQLRKTLNYLPMLLTERQDILSPRNWQRRPRLSFFTQLQIDRTLHFGKIRARAPGQNLFKSDGVPYTTEEVTRSRLLCKVIDGNILLSKELARIYPDATFVGLIRNGLAVAEGHIRRGADICQIAERYECGCQAMIEYSNSLPNFHIFRYEDCVAEPVKSLHKIYKIAGLDTAVVEHVRLETKQIINKAGEHEFVRSADEKRVIWYRVDEISQHLRKDVNDNQIARLTGEQKEIVLRVCQQSLEYFRYN